MKDAYDFTTARRGKFFREGARLVPPISLEPDVLAYLSELAVKQGATLSELANSLLKKDIERIKASR